MIEEAIETLKEKPLIVYNWSPDGLLASIITLAYATPTREYRIIAVDTWKPAIDLLEKIAIDSRETKSVALLGVGWSGSDIDLLASMVLAPVVVVDNAWNLIPPRRQNVIYYNPSPKGDRMGSWPSVASLVSMGLGHPHPFLTAASIVSVMGDTARSNRLYQSLMAMAGLDHNSDYDLAWNCAMQTYGITSMGDPVIHGEVARSLVEADRDPCKAILKDALLTSFRGMAEASLEDAVTNADIDEDSDVVIVNAIGEGRHEYYLSRLFGLQFKDKIVLTAYSDQLSGRLTACAWHVSGKKPIATLLPYMKSKGYEVYGSYHGLVNYLCFRKEATPAEHVEDFLTAIDKVWEA